MSLHECGAVAGFSFSLACLLTTYPALALTVAREYAPNYRDCPVYEERTDALIQKFRDPQAQATNSWLK